MSSLYKLFVSDGWPLIAVPFRQIGVEQLSSLQHLDLAYNLLLEHSQLAPLSLLHCLNTVRKHTDAHTHLLFRRLNSVQCLFQLNLEGNPLYFHKTHRQCTVRHLSPKAANLRVSNNDARLTCTHIPFTYHTIFHIFNDHSHM